MARARSANPFCLFFSALLCALPGSQQPASQRDATIRIKVGLIQTDLMVFDKQGHFVPDLQMEQFELRIDGKIQPIASFEMISASSPHDEEIWAMAEKRPVLPVGPPSAAVSMNPGRTLLYFVDDWHLSADSVMRCRAALSKLINISVGAHDRVGIFAASGQLGSEKMLTSDKPALLSLLAKFNHRLARWHWLRDCPLSEAEFDRGQEHSGFGCSLILLSSGV
jgi:VWFA-related protein